MHFQSTERPEEDANFVRAGDDYTADQMAANDPLDDVFGSDANDATEVLLTSAASHSHPSDINRLQTEHTTAGYREGVSVAKEKSIQAGFDEGFSLGATIGLKAGQLLGMLEGIVEAIRAESGDGKAALGEDEARVADKTLSEARIELSKGKVFSAQYWAPDGNWTFDVPEPAAGEEIVFSDVAAAHPLIRKWTEIVDGQIKRWRINVSLLDDDGTARLEMGTDDHVVSSAVPTVAKPLDW
ncbi:Protein YAE1 [Paramyrothecium foliicola]|nr:Protein YAE1 [Paramyrothecium foliicola]